MLPSKKMVNKNFNIYFFHINVIVNVTKNYHHTYRHVCICTNNYSLNIVHFSYRTIYNYTLMLLRDLCRIPEFETAEQTPSLTVRRLTN